ADSPIRNVAPAWRHGKGRLRARRAFATGTSPHSYMSSNGDALYRHRIRLGVKSSGSAWNPVALPCDIQRLRGDEGVLIRARAVDRGDRHVQQPEVHEQL